MKKVFSFIALVCLIVSVSSCTPETISSMEDTYQGTGGNEIDDPAEPDEDD